MDNKATNFLVDLLEILKKICNFETTVVAEDELAGTRNPFTHKWTGLIDILQNKKADILLDFLILSSSRSEVVDFLIPLYEGSRRIYIKKNNVPMVPYTAYFQVWFKFIIIVVDPISINSISIKYFLDYNIR